MVQTQTHRQKCVQLPFYTRQVLYHTAELHLRFSLEGGDHGCDELSDVFERRPNASLSSLLGPLQHPRVQNSHSISHIIRLPFLTYLNDFNINFTTLTRYLLTKAPFWGVWHDIPPPPRAPAVFGALSTQPKRGPAPLWHKQGGMGRLPTPRGWVALGPDSPLSRPNLWSGVRGQNTAPFSMRTTPHPFLLPPPSPIPFPSLPAGETLTLPLHTIPFPASIELCLHSRTATPALLAAWFTFQSLLHFTVSLYLSSKNCTIFFSLVFINHRSTPPSAFRK